MPVCYLSHRINSNFFQCYSKKCKLIPKQNYQTKMYYRKFNFLKIISIIIIFIAIDIVNYVSNNNGYSKNAIIKSVNIFKNNNSSKDTSHLYLVKHKFKDKYFHKNLILNIEISYDRIKQKVNNKYSHLINGNKLANQKIKIMQIIIKQY